MSLPTILRRVAYWSPLPPDRSGIADYSAELLEHLTKRCEVEIFTGEGSNPSPDIAGRYSIWPGRAFNQRHAENPFHINLYQMGNHARYHEHIYRRILEQPGITVLHDLSLFDFYWELLFDRGQPGAFLDEAAYSDGTEASDHVGQMLAGERPVDRLRAQLTRRVIESSLGVIVHSRWACDVLRERYPDRQIFHVHEGAPLLDGAVGRAVQIERGWRDDQLVVGVFGTLSPMKRTHVVVDVFGRLHKIFPKVRLLLVGYEGDTAYGEQIRSMIRDSEPEGVVSLIGETSLDQLQRYLQAVDLVINLRWPTAGETSAIMMRAFGAGKVVITSDVPQFREYDNTFCWRISTEPAEERLQLFERLVYGATQIRALAAAGQSAQEFIRQCATWEAVAGDYAEVIKKISAPQEPKPVSAKVNLIGDLTAASGLSEATRITLDAMLRHGIAVSYTNLPYRYEKRSSAKPDPVHLRLPVGNIYPFNLMFYNVNEFHTLSEEQLRELTCGKYTIAYWFWELSELPVEYRHEAERIDEIWVSSRYVQAGMRNAANVPVTVIPLPIKVQPAAEMTRKAFGIPEGCYVFLFTFSAASCNARKNPSGVLAAFEQAFGSVRLNDTVGPLLVIKVQHLERFPELQSELRSAVSRVGGLLLEDSYTREQMDSLLNCADVYVSLHRSEGFGLGMAESMALGKPVIATNYSGNTDFMTAENSYPVGYLLRQITEQDHVLQPECANVYRPGQFWAEPNTRQAVFWMRYLYENPGEGRQRGQRAKEDIRRLCSPAVVGKRIEERLTQIREQ